jgi:cholesterol oxidase
MKAEFTEEMIGFYTPGSPAYDAGYVTGQRDRRSLMFRLTVGTDDVAGLLADPGHRMAARGFVRCPELGSAEMPVTRGTVDLFAPGRLPGRLAMRYRLPFDSDRGPMTLLGVKDVGDDRGIDVWADTTTLFTRLVPAADADFDHSDDDEFARGILRLNAPMFARQLTTLRGDPLGLVRFGWFFTGRLIAAYGRPSAVDIRP